ncbi:MAG: transcriptional regulator [Thermoguttaceae bacterium]|nr:transcriptional regulator [Thermoguttaceae bacterium]
MSASNSQAIRLIALLKMMTQTPGTPAYFANALDVDERTIRRYVQQLRDAGFPIVADRATGRLELASDYGVPPVEFTEREALAILVLFHEAGATLDGNLFASLRGAAAKLASTLSPTLLDFVEATRSRVAMKRGAVDKSSACPSSTKPEPEITNDYPMENLNATSGDSRDRFFDAIFDACLARRPFEARYQGPGGPTLTTTVHPYAVFYSRAWYVVGYSSLHRETRTFKIARFESVEPSDAKFLENLNFSLDSYFGDAWRFIRGPRTRRVVVRFSEKVGANVAEVRWHKTQQTRVLPNGSVELEFRVAGLTEIIWWILGYGAEAEVLEPPELREMVAEHARRVLERFENPPSKRDDDRFGGNLWPRR